VSTNSRKTRTITYGTCRRQIVKMVSRSPFLFPVYKHHFVFLRWSLSICVGHTSCGLGAPQNVGMAAGISQICYSCQKLFLFPVYKCHLFFPVIIIYLRRAHILWIGRPRKYRNSRWNFTNILFLSEVISISGLQAPFCFFTVIIIYLCRTYIFGLGAPENVGIAAGISQICYS